MAIGKTAPNGALNADGAFYSVQDVNVLLENAGGGGGADLPTPTVADAGSVVVVDESGKYALGEAGGGVSIFYVAVLNDSTDPENPIAYLDKNYSEIKSAYLNNNIVMSKREYEDVEEEEVVHTIDIGNLTRLEENDTFYSVTFMGVPYIAETATGRLEVVQ